MWGANSSTIVITPVAYAAKAACTLPVLKPSMNWRTGALTSSWLARMVAGAQKTTAGQILTTFKGLENILYNHVKLKKVRIATTPSTIASKFPVTLFGTLPASYAHFLPLYDYQRSSCRRCRSKWQTACSRIISGSYRGPQRTANDSA